MSVENGKKPSQLQQVEIPQTVFDVAVRSPTVLLSGIETHPLFINADPVLQQKIKGMNPWELQAFVAVWQGNADSLDAIYQKSRSIQLMIIPDEQINFNGNVSEPPELKIGRHLLTKGKSFLNSCFRFFPRRWR